MAERRLELARVVSVIAATVIALACGTNYAYSAWAPQFAIKLNLSSTEINLIGTAGNLGMYASGIPLGMLVDAKGPSSAVILGAMSLGLGYYPIYRASLNGAGSMSVPWLCFFSFLTGLGSCAAFSAAVKTSALNWPKHRGTAPAFPMAGFGLSAFFFSAISSLLFPEDASDLLLLLAIGTFTMVAVSFFFLRVVAPSKTDGTVYPVREDDVGPVQFGRLRSSLSSERLHDLEQSPVKVGDDSAVQETGLNGSKQDAEETSSLLSESSTATSNDIGLMGDGRYKHQEHARIDLRGLAMLPRVEFWQLFSLLGLLTGIGLMTINNIGNNAQALWSYYDKDIPARFIRKRQFLLVCVISLTNFLGRLASGVGSDFLQKRLGRSRYWCLVTSSTIFAAAQLCAIRIENPHLLLTVAVLSGLAYGTTFGVYPALVTEAFGVHGLSQNWGFMCMAGIICAHVFNLIYGSVYDHHSTRLALNHDHPPHPLFPSSVSGSGSGTGSASASASAASGSSAAGERICSQGIRCYRTAYLVTLAASLVALVVSAWGVYSDRGKMQALHQPKARKTTTTTTQKKRKKKTTTTTTKTTPTIRRGERNGESSAMMTA